MLNSLLLAEQQVAGQSVRCMRGGPTRCEACHLPRGGRSLLRFLPVWSTLVATATWKGPSTSSGSFSLMSQFCRAHGKHSQQAQPAVKCQAEVQR